MENKKKHIGFLVDSIGGGGAERVVSVLANKFYENGYKVSVITFREKKDEYFLNKGVNRITLYDLKQHNRISYVFLPIKLLNEMNKMNCDIYISMSVSFNISSCFVKYFKKFKLIISERNAPNNVKLNFLTKLSRKLLFHKADRYVFQTEEAKQFYSTSIQKRSEIIENPLKENLPYKLEETENMFISVGRLTEQKNYPMLLYAFQEFNKSFPGYTLNIFGDGHLKENLLSLAKKLEIDQDVNFKGFSSNVFEYMQKSKIFLMSSDFEGMPNSLMEAMAMGLPVISTDCPVGGPRHLIKDGVNGSLVAVGDVKGFASKMIKLATDENMYSSYSRESKKIRETHNLGNIYKKWEIYVNLLLE